MIKQDKITGDKAVRAEEAERDQIEHGHLREKTQSAVAADDASILAGQNPHSMGAEALKMMDRTKQEKKRQSELHRALRSLENFERHLKKLRDVVGQLRSEAVAHDTKSQEFFAQYEDMKPLADDLQDKVDRGEKLTLEERRRVIEHIKEARRKMGKDDDLPDQISDAVLVSLLVDTTDQTRDAAIREHDEAVAKNDAANAVDQIVGELEQIRNSDLGPEERAAAYQRALEDARNSGLLEELQAKGLGNELIDIINEFLDQIDSVKREPEFTTSSINMPDIGF